MTFLRCSAAIAALLVVACNNSSDSQTQSDNAIVETFVTASQHTISPLDINPSCVPDSASNSPLPEGLLVFKRGEQPTRLVVFSHGIGHTVQASWLPHMRRELRLAQHYENSPGGVAFVATDYRDNLGFPTLRGAYDTIAATEYALEKFPSIDTVYLFGVSMGGAVSGTAIVESAAISDDGKALYDYWITAEGVNQLVETYGEAKAAAEATGNATAMAAAAGIERDTGGTPAECPLAYQRRSPALHAAQMQLGGVQAATVIHPVNDGLVPHNQGREMAGALTTAGIATQFFTVVGIPEGQDPGTTGTGTLGAGEADGTLNLAGHGSEADATHPVMRTAFEQLRKMLDGQYNAEAPYFECIVDHRAPEDSCQADQF